MTGSETHQKWTTFFNCAPPVHKKTEFAGCISRKTLKLAGAFLAKVNMSNFVNSALTSKFTNRRSAMRKHSSGYYHRMFMWAALLTGATLLLLNVWMITSSDSDLLLIPWLAE